MLIRDAKGEVIGAVGVTGDTEDRDEELAAYGIRTAGLKTDADCIGMGRRVGLPPQS
jgi:Haem degrading protein HbpS-like